nr:hypothetical protein [Propionivibrio sp.]
MRATEHDLVCARVQRRCEMAAGAFDKSGVVEMHGFDLGGPAGAGQHVDLNRSGVLPDQSGEPLATRRCRRRQHGDAATCRRGGGRFDARLDADHRDAGQRVAQRRNCGRSGRVAGNHDNLATLIDQMTTDA